MRILHASHKGLPDHRIEREAYVAKAAGHSVEFLGMGNKTSPSLDVFDRITMLRNINNREAARDRSIRTEWTEAVKTIDPDIVHANDIIPAKFTLATGYPMVYDDHEYWSKQLIQFEVWPFYKRIAIRPFTRAVPIWEKEILKTHVTLTVSEAIAREHRRYCSHVFVLNNYSLKEEVELLDAVRNREGAVYVGSDFDRKKFAPHRDLTGLTDCVNFDVLSGLPRAEMYKNLIKYRLGLVPFRVHPYHEYADSSKTYDYLACGLQVLMSRMIFEAHGRLPFTHPFDDYSELANMIKTCKNVSSSEIMEYSHKQLVWDAQKDKLFEAYDTCLSLS